ncbi:MAG: sigma-70 family RNA polymerase sigma factor [Pseudomonadota bacterium]
MGIPSKTEARADLRSIDRAQIDAYAQEFQPALTAFFMRRCACPDLSNDLVQDVFLRLLRRKQAGEIDHPAAYVMQTASSVWNDHLRAGQVRHAAQHEEYGDGDHSPEGFSPERVYEGREAINRIFDALSRLPERTQDIYILCRFDGYKRHEVAKRLGISVSAVDKHLMTATKRVGQVFGELT